MADTPCGSCRQVLAEFGVDTIVVIIADDEGRVSRSARSLICYRALSCPAIWQESELQLDEHCAAQL